MVQTRRVRKLKEQQHAPASVTPSLVVQGNLPAQLPFLEAWFHVAVWCGALAYAVYGVYLVSEDSEEVLNDYDLVTGWTWIGRRKDASNFEWDFYLSWYHELWPWFAGHILLGRVAVLLFPQWRKQLFLGYSMVTLYFVMGHKSLLLLLTHCVCALLASLLKSVVFIWVVCLALLSTLNFHPFTQFMKLACDNDPFEKKYYLLVFTLAMTNLRCISSSVEWCHARRAASKGDTQHSYTILDTFLYLFYLPLFVCGPIMTFDDFERQINTPLEPWTKQKVVSWSLGTARIVFWAFFCEFILHFFYFNSVEHDLRLMESIPLWALGGIGYSHGQFFMVKYVVMFGLMSCLAKLDQLEPPDGPRCISWVYLYSQMWSYIFVPLGGSRHGLLRSLLASMACFSMVFYWHGAEEYLFIWTFLNFIGISLETLGSKFARIPQVQELEESWLSPGWGRRVRSAATTPLFMMSAIAIFYFLGGKEVGDVIYRRLIRNAGPVPLLTLSLVMYSGVQTGKEIERWRNRETRMKED